MKFKFKFDDKCTVTQLDDGVFSHKGSSAWDIASRSSNTKLGYSCNVELECKAVDQASAFTWWQTTEKVEYANGIIDYLTIMCGHDDKINAKVGMKIKPHVRIGNMGCGGNSTGDHLHIEFGRGRYVGKWYPNKYNIYVLYNAMKFEDVTFADDLNFIRPNFTDVLKRWDTIQFKYAGNSSEIQEPSDEIEKINVDIQELKTSLKTLENSHNDVIEKLNKIKDILGA